MALVLAFFTKSKVVKAVLSLVCLIVMFFLSLLLQVFILPNYIGIHGVWLSYVVGGAIFIVIMMLTWKPFRLKTRLVIIFLVIITPISLTAVLAGNELIKHSIAEAPGEEISLFDYMPFGDSMNGDSRYFKVKSLNEVSSLQLQNNLPRLDGATALYPLYSAFVRATYPEREYNPYADFRDNYSDLEPIVICSRTSGAFENLVDGYADIVFLMGVSEEQRDMAESRGLELILTPIGREAFVFFVNKRNVISNLSAEDIIRIYSGEIDNWRDVGGNNDAIRAYQRPAESGSQTMLKQIMGNTPIIPAPQEAVYGSMMGMYRQVANYKNYKNSLGYSFLYYIQDMINENEVKFLSINGISPTKENIASGAYPFANDFYAVMVKRDDEYLNIERTENIDRLLDWINSPQGQYLVETTGYVPFANKRNRGDHRTITPNLIELLF